jgi:hypothetical protein
MDITKKQNRFEGFDFLRAFFSVVVVALHSNLFSLLGGKVRLGFVSDILSLNIGYLAVPVFLQISLFLFYLKRDKAGSEYFPRNRLPKLVCLYLFWVLLKTIVGFILTGEFREIKSGLASFQGFFEFVIGGGNTIFYFFFSLLFTTFIAELLSSLLSRVKNISAKAKINYNLLFGSCLLVFSFPLIDVAINHREVLTKIINSLNFLPYVFTTAIVVQEFKEGKLENMTPLLRLKLWKLFAFCLLFTMFEWIFLNNISFSVKLFHYSRISLVLFSWLLLYIALLSVQKPSMVVTIVSGFSLGIYGFHTFLLDGTKFLNGLSMFIPGLGTVTAFIVALLGSITLTFFSKKIKYLNTFI